LAPEFPGDPFSPTIGYLLLAHFRRGGLRPTIGLEATDHSLAVDQRDGISLAKAWQIAHYDERQQ
jgi:hypothetical protein